MRSPDYSTTGGGGSGGVSVANSPAARTPRQFRESVSIISFLGLWDLRGGQGDPACPCQKWPGGAGRTVLQRVPQFAQARRATAVGRSAVGVPTPRASQQDRDLGWITLFPASLRVPDYSELTVQDGGRPCFRSHRCRNIHRLFRKTSTESFGPSARPPRPPSLTGVSRHPVGAILLLGRNHC